MLVAEMSGSQDDVGTEKERWKKRQNKMFTQQQTARERERERVKCLQNNRQLESETQSEVFTKQQTARERGRMGYFTLKYQTRPEMFSRRKRASLLGKNLS